MQVSRSSQLEGVEDEFDKYLIVGEKNETMDDVRSNFISNG